MVSPKSELNKYYHKGLSKLLSGKIIKEEFPMVDYIDCYVIDEIDRIYMKIHLNDETINSENMYEKSFIPYQVTDLVEKFLPYFGISSSNFGMSQRFKFNYNVLSPSGESIYQYGV